MKKNKLQIGKDLEVERFIYGITRQIWESKQINSIYDYYNEDVIVRSPRNTTYNCKDVIDSTKDTLSQFPDRQLIGEDVIWSGDCKNGILSSHRILSTATHKGNGFYGKSTEKNIMYRVIADCFIIDNKVVEEWIVRDESAILNQLGLSIKTFVKMKIKEKIFNKSSLDSISNAFVYKNIIKNNSNEFTETYISYFKKLIDKNFNLIKNKYERSAQTFWPGGKINYSHEQIKKTWSDFLSCFENLELIIHFFSGITEPMLSPRVAIRWTIKGIHLNNGYYGSPSQKNIEIAGISHVEFGKTGIIREYVIFDEISIWKQILL